MFLNSIIFRLDFVFNKNYMLLDQEIIRYGDNHVDAVQKKADA